MHANRPTRNATQVRSIIQNMGRSIDEARSRRLGPTAGAALAGPSAIDIRIGAATAGSTETGSLSSTNHPKATAAASTTASSNSVPPPVRSAGEMFADGGPRLKARPTSAS